MGDQGVWHPGPGRHRRGLHGWDDPPPPRARPLPRPVFIREEGLGQEHHLLDSVQVSTNIYWHCLFKLKGLMVFDTLTSKVFYCHLCHLL